MKTYDAGNKTLPVLDLVFRSIADELMRRGKMIHAASVALGQ